MFRSKLTELVMPEMRKEVKAHDLSIAVVGLGATVGLNAVFEPLLQELFDGLLLGCDIETSCLVAMQGFELVGDLLAGLAIDDLALALAVDDPKIDGCAPAAVGALIDRAFAMSSSGWHRFLRCRAGIWIS